MAYAPNFNDPAYGYSGGGILGSQPAAQPRGILSGFGGAFRQLLDPQTALPMAAALIGGRNPQESLAGAFAAAAPGLAATKRRMAINDWLKAKSSGDPAALESAKANLINAAPELGMASAAYDLTPKAPIEMSPGSRLAQYDPAKGQYVEQGGASGRGDGTPYDINAAKNLYEAKYGTAGNRDANSPDFGWFYKNEYPSFGTAAPAAPGSSPPMRGKSESDVRRGIMAANAIAKNYIEYPIYKLVSNASPYISRIDVAANKRNSAGDVELIDSSIKLATGGGQITEGQTSAYGAGRSYWDTIAIAKQKLENGGILSDDQRQQIKELSHEVFAAYQKQFQPLYDEAMSQMDKAGVDPEYRGVMPDLNKISRAGGVAGGNGEAPKAGDNGLPAVRPRAINPQTGAAVEFDGSAWVPAQ